MILFGTRDTELLPDELVSNRPTIYIIGLVFFGGGVAFPQGQLMRLIRHLTRGDIFPFLCPPFLDPDHLLMSVFVFSY